MREVGGSRAFASADLLDGRWPDIERPALARLLDAEVQRLGSLGAQASLAIGRGLSRLLARDAKKYRALSHSRVKDFVHARYGLSVGAAYELRDLARGLEGLPILRAAFESGRLCTRKVRSLLRVITPATEAGWTAFAQRRSERAVQDAVRATLAARREDSRNAAATPSAGASHESTEPAEDQDAERTDVLSWQATPDEHAAWHWGLEMLRVVVGEELPTWRLAELLVANAGASPPEPSPEDVAEREGSAARGRREHDVAPLDEGRLADLATLLRTPPVVHRLDLDDPADADDPWVIHERTLAAVAARNALAFEQSALLSLMHGSRIHLTLGFPSIHAYAHARLGLSPKAAAMDLRLQLETCVSPELARAWHAGMPASTVALLARVATPDTAAAWVAFAERASRKRLDIEARWHQAALAALGLQQYIHLTAGVPDGGVSEQQRQLDWEEFFGVREQRRQRRRRRGVTRGENPLPSPDDADPSDLELDALEREVAQPKSTVSFRGPADVVAMFRAALDERADLLERLRGTRPTLGDCVVSLLVEFAHEHAPADRRVRESPVLARDAHRCSAPHCSARSELHGHHVHWRSRGGTDDRWNLSTHCAGCHALIHEDVIDVRGRAPDALIHRVGRRSDGSWREAWRNGIRLTGTA